MNEDKELNDFLRSRLEGDVPGEIPHFDAIMRAASEQSSADAAERRSHRRFWGSSLLAASLAVVCTFVVVTLQTSSPAPETTMANAIDILRVVDGAESLSEETSVAEMLLAWQDAPYESAISDLTL